AESMIYSARYPLARRRFKRCEMVPGLETPINSQSNRTGGIVKRRLSSITRNSSRSRGVNFGTAAAGMEYTLPHLTGYVQLYDIWRVAMARRQAQCALCGSFMSDTTAEPWRCPKCGTEWWSGKIPQTASEEDQGVVICVACHYSLGEEDAVETKAGTMCAVCAARCYPIIDNG